MFESIHEKAPELAKLQAVVTKLEQEVYEASNRVAELQAEAASVREDDLLREAKALNEGRRVPTPKEPEVKAKLEGAARRAEVLQRRLQLAQSDVANYISQHSSELAALVQEAKAAKAREVSELAEPLAQVLNEFQLPDADARALRPYLEAPQEENRGSPQSSVAFIGPVGTQNVFGGDRIAGEPIGRVEALVRELTGLAARYEGGGDAERKIVGPTPEESGEGVA